MVSHAVTPAGLVSKPHQAPWPHFHCLFPIILTVPYTGCLVPIIFLRHSLNFCIRRCNRSKAPEGQIPDTEIDNRYKIQGSKITADGDCCHKIKRHLLPGRKAMINLDSILKSRDITLPTKVHLDKTGFSSSHVWKWVLGYQEGWAPKDWCFWTVVLEKTLESPLDCKEIKPVNPKGNQSWIFIGRTDAEAEAPILWPPDVKNWLTGKDPDAGRDWRQEKGMTEDEMVGWHHQLNWHEFEQAPGVGDGQGSLACYSPWGHRVGHDWATDLNKGDGGVWFS